MVAAAGSCNLEGHLTLRRAIITMYISIQIEGGQKLKVIKRKKGVANFWNLNNGNKKI